MGKIKHQLNRKLNQNIFSKHPLLRQVSCTEVSVYVYIHCCCPFTQSCPVLYDPMNCSTPGLTVPHCLPKFAQVHVHCISDAIQPSHPLMSSSPSALSLSQHQHPTSQLFASDDQNTWASASILPVSIQGWFPLRLTGLISLLSKGLSGVFSSTTVWSHQFFVFMVQVSQLYVTTGKTIALTIRSFVGRVISLLFNTLSRFVIAFLPRNKHLLISWLQSPSTVILEPKKKKCITTSTFSPSICHEVMGQDAITLVFFKPAISLSSFTLIKRLFSSSSHSAIRVVSSAYLRLLMFLLPILIPACNSSSPAFLMMCSVYRLNK